MASSVALLALVDALALLGGLFLVWRAVKRFWRFCGVARRKSLEAAFRGVRQVSWRQAMRCATDENYYLSRLSLLFCTNVISVTGLIFAGVTLAGDDHSLSDASPAWSALASGSLIAFTVLSIRSFYRTVRLARQVLQLRRKIRTVAARKRRLALLEAQSSRPAQRPELVQR